MDDVLMMDGGSCLTSVLLILFSVQLVNFHINHPSTVYLGILL